MALRDPKKKKSKDFLLVLFSIILTLAIFGLTLYFRSGAFD